MKQLKQETLSQSQAPLALALGKEQTSPVIILAPLDVSVDQKRGPLASFFHALTMIPEQPWPHHLASLGFTFLLCKVMCCLQPIGCKLKLLQGQASNVKWGFGAGIVPSTSCTGKTKLGDILDQWKAGKCSITGFLGK